MSISRRRLQFGAFLQMIGWVRRIANSRHRVPKGFVLSEVQIQSLIRLSGCYLRNYDGILAACPEVGTELQRFFDSKGQNWRWFPNANNSQPLEQIIRACPSSYELIGQSGVDGQFAARLYEMGIASPDGGITYRRARVFIEPDLTLEQFLAELKRLPK